MITTDQYKKLKRRDLLNARKKFAGSKIYTHENIMTFESIPPLMQVSDKIICGYYPMTSPTFDEIDILPLLKYLSQNNTILIPKTIRESRILEFGEIDFTKNIDQQISTDNPYKIKEPIYTIAKNDLHLDYILTPALGMDKEFHRIGYGGGYYDNTLTFYKNINPALVSIGICLSDCYLINEEFQTNEYDVRLDSLLTEKEFINYT